MAEEKKQTNKKEESEKKVAESKKIEKAPAKKNDASDKKKSVDKNEGKEEVGKDKDAKKPSSKEEKKSSDDKTEKKEEKKPEVKRPKKNKAIVSVQNIPISTKHSAAICKFIKGKEINKAMIELEEVIKLRKAIPMKGEIPHRKGKGMMSGRYPIKATQNFVKLLKSLSGNASYNGMEEPIIVEAVANLGARPYGRFGQVRKKRTHIRLVAKEKPAKTGGKK